MFKVLKIWCLLSLFLVYFPDTTAQNYTRIEDVFISVPGKYFGFYKGYQPKSNITRYRVVRPASDNSDDLTQAWFDVSNNNIVCSINANGLVEYPSVMGPLNGCYAENVNELSTFFGKNDYITGSQWNFSISDGKQSALLSDLNNTSLDLIDNLFYKWNYRFNDLGIEMLIFAPEGFEDPLIPEPRAMITVLKVTNNGPDRVKGKLSVPKVIKDVGTIGPDMPKAHTYGPALLPVANSHRGDRSNFHPRFAEVAPTVAGYEAVAILDSLTWYPAFPDLSFSLNSGESTYMKVAFMVGTSAKELLHTVKYVRSKNVTEWLNSTKEIHHKATGTLRIPEDPALEEMFCRYYECGHSCYLLNGEGTLSEPKGGSWSIMSILNPGYVLGCIKSNQYLTGMVPNYVSDLKSTISFSLYGTTNELIMASDYYQRTGDCGLIITREFREYATTMINNILSTKYPEATLFPSRNIWDGPSRGDYHTGSQILVWRVLDQFSGIAKDLWKDTLNATLWTRRAAKCRKDIFAKCKIPGPYGDQFAEGAWRNSKIDSAAKCHDGEEVALVQSAFYGFAEKDNPLVVNHCKASMTPFNYLYHSNLNAMMWQSESYWNGGYTFPAWLVMVAGATTKAELISALEFWKSMTDIDGSPWWWPYDVQQTDPSKVNRRRCNYVGGFCDIAKVSYATSVFNTLLINNVLGLSADVPLKTVAFSPFSLWSRFEWKNGRIGNAFFDISYVDDGSAITCTIINRNRQNYRGIIGITVPEGKALKGVKATGKRFGRDYIEVERTLLPDQEVSYTVGYQSYCDLLKRKII